MTLDQLIEKLGGTLVYGSPDLTIAGVDATEMASEGDLVFAEDAVSARDAFACGASAVVLKTGCIPIQINRKFFGVIEIEQPRLWFAKAAKLLAVSPPDSGIHPSAVIGPNVELGHPVSIGPCAVIGEAASIGAGTRIDAGVIVGARVPIGSGCHIYPRAVVYSGTEIGNRVVVHAGAVLGANGFGYVRDAKTGAYTQFPQQGTLVIEDDVEIGANSTIDRGALKQTRIGRGTRSTTWCTSVTTATSART